jgi:hypothetical protein
MSGRLILIASYPKSGNTWVRLFFENLLRGSARPVSINDIEIGFYGYEQRLFFDSLAPILAADMLPDEIDDLMPELFAELVAETTGPVFVKVHDRARLTPNGRWIFPVELVDAVIYLARHPFDVAVSYANHRGVPLVQVVADLCDEDHAIARAGPRMPLPLAERPGSWSSHFESWTRASPYPVTLARYEDLYSRPLQEFARLAAAARLDATEAQIARAVQATKFDDLKAQETEAGFRERPRVSPAFFNHGRPDTWRGALSHHLQLKIVSTQCTAMTQLGYMSG